MSWCSQLNTCGPAPREWFLGWLTRVPRYERLYARGAYADRRYRRWLADRVGPLLRRHRLDSGSGRDAPGIPGDEEANWPTRSLPQASSDHPTPPAFAE